MSDHTGSDSVKEKLLRALKHKAVLAERSKLLQQQVEDFRSREASMNHIASELLQRQRELNFMLHRASSVLHQMQDTNLALSAEFTHLVKELPAPKEGEENAAPEWEETISRVNDLFRRTHELAGEMQDEIFRSANGSPLPDPGRDIAAVSVAGPIAPEPVPAPVVDPPGIELSQPEPVMSVTEHSQAEEYADSAPTIEAELVADQPLTPTAASEPVEEAIAVSSPEPEIVEARIVEPQADAEPVVETEEDQSVDDVFRRLNAITAEKGEWRDDAPAVSDAPRKPSLLARIFGMADDE